MRILIVILLFPLFTFAQGDSIVLSFADTSKEINESQKQELLPLVSKRAYKIKVQVYIGQNAAVSLNRINGEYRVSSLSQYLYKYDIPQNSIYIKRILTKDPNKFNKIVLTFDFVSAKGKNVLYKTATYEELDIGVPSKRKTKKKTPKKIKKKPKVIKTYGKFRIEDFKKGQKIVIPDLIFYATRHVLERSSMRSLNHLVAIMQDKPSLVIQLQGHICCKRNGKDGMDFGTNTDNLSENRAIAVCKYLMQHGIDYRRLSFVGYGSKFKRVDDQGDYGKGRLNRRVEIFVVSE